MTSQPDRSSGHAGTDAPDTVGVLADCEPFRHLRVDALEALIARGKPVTYRPGEHLIGAGEYGTTLHAVLEGEAEVLAAGPDGGALLLAVLGPGTVAGEVGALTGSRRSASVVAKTSVRALEMEAAAIEAAAKESPEFAEAVEAIRGRRSVETLLRQIPLLESIWTTGGSPGLLVSVTEESFEPGQTICREGESGDSLMVVRDGFVKVTRLHNGAERIIGYHGPRSFFGETALLSEDGLRTATVVAHTDVELVVLPGSTIQALAGDNPEVQTALENAAAAWEQERLRVEADPGRLDTVESLFEAGAVGAEKLLAIDSATCIHCDRCVEACAERHGERRLRREGQTMAGVTLPVACRLCPDPVCLLCPYDGIRRAPTGEIYITDKCVGCTACVHRCPYDVIAMRSAMEPTSAGHAQAKGILWELLAGAMGLFGRDAGALAGKAETATATEPGHDRAVKCDHCFGYADAACVCACPVSAMSWLSLDSGAGR